MEFAQAYGRSHSPRHFLLGPFESRHGFGLILHPSPETRLDLRHFGVVGKVLLRLRQGRLSFFQLYSEEAVLGRVLGVREGLTQIKDPRRKRRGISEESQLVALV